MVILLLVIGIILFWPTDDASDVTDFDRYWTEPQNTFETWVAFWTEMQVYETMLGVEQKCSGKCPLSEEQGNAWRKASLVAAQPLVREYQVDLTLNCLWHEVEMSRLRSRVSSRCPVYRGLAEIQLDMAVAMNLMQYSNALLDRQVEEWMALASVEQKEATHDYFFGEKRGLCRTGKNTKNAISEKFRRYLKGELAEHEIFNWRIEPDGPKELSHIAPLECMPWEPTWHFIVARFVFDNRLTPEQQESAKAILEECQKRALALRQFGNDEVTQQWRQLVHAYVFPKNSEITAKQAMRQYRRVTEEPVRTIYEEMLRRLDDLLSEEQRESREPPLPKPSWMEFMAIILEDGAEKVSG